MRSKIRWRFVAGLCFAATAAISATILTPIIKGHLRQSQEHRAALPHAIPATDAQQRDILRAIVTKNEYLGGPPPPPEEALPPQPGGGSSIALEDTSIAFCATSALKQETGKSCAPVSLQASLLSIDFDDRIPRKLRQELLLANRQPTRIKNPRLPQVTYLPRNVLSQGVAKNASWAEFYKQYPGLGGFLKVSRAVMSADRTRALIYVEHACSGGCGDGTLHYLELSGTTWHETAQINLWMV